MCDLLCLGSVNQSPTLTFLFLLHPQHISKDMLNEQDDNCLFTTHLMLETDMLCFEPAESEFHSTISEILARFQECTRAVPNLIPDSFFHSFTRCHCLYTAMHTHVLFLYMLGGGGLPLCGLWQMNIYCSETTTTQACLGYVSLGHCRAARHTQC